MTDHRVNPDDPDDYDPEWVEQSRDDGTERSDGLDRDDERAAE